MEMTLELRDESGDLVALWKLDTDAGVDADALASQIVGALTLHAADNAPR